MARNGLSPNLHVTIIDQIVLPFSSVALRESFTVGGGRLKEPPVCAQQIMRYYHRFLPHIGQNSLCGSSLLQYENSVINNIVRLVTAKTDVVDHVTRLLLLLGNSLHYQSDDCCPVTISDGHQHDIDTYWSRLRSVH